MTLVHTRITVLDCPMQTRTISNCVRRTNQVLELNDAIQTYDGPLELLESASADGYRVTNVTSFTSERDGDKAISKILCDFQKSSMVAILWTLFHRKTLI